MRPLLGLFPILLALAPASGMAQTIPSNYRFLDTRQEAGVFVGFAIKGRGLLGLGPGNGPMMGGRYAILVGGPFSLEVNASYLPSTRNVLDPDGDSGLEEIGEADLNLMLVDARLKFSLVGPRTWRNLSPYFIAGGGVVFDISPDQVIDQILPVDDRFEFGRSFAGTLGVGTKWFPSGSVMFRGDLGFTLWQLETPRGYLLLDRQELLGILPENEWVSTIGLSFGAALHF